jgi:tricorn protease
VPVENGDPRNLTNSPGVHDRSPAWSPDGKWIAYFSDEGGEYGLVLRSQDGSGEPRRFKLTGAGYYDSPGWAPKSDRLAFVDNSGTLFSLDVATGEQHKVATDPHFDSERGLDYSWSPDGRWLAYTRTAPTDYRQLYLYSFDGDRSFPLTDGLADVGQPSFDAGGKYLYFRMSTDSGPTNAGFDMSSFGLRPSDSIYVAVLARGAASPLAPRSDEEKTAGGPAGAATPAASRPPTATMTIDVQSLQSRMIPLPVTAALYDQIQAGAEEKVYYLSINPGEPPFGQPAGKLMRYDLKARKEDQLLDNAVGFTVSADGTKILAKASGSWKVLDAAGSDHPDAKNLPVDAVQIRVEPRAEWQEMYEDAWRTNRDFFYDPHMHGVDWNAMREKYAQFLPDLATRADLNRLISWLFSELRVSHHSVFGGDIPATANPITVGLLGADYTVDNNHYRFAKIYGGYNWFPTVKAPLGQPGAEVKTGEYLLAVDGRPLTADESIYHRFENTVDRVTQITVGPNPQGDGSRTISVVPVGGENALRQLDWIEGNRLKVDQASGGRIAYVNVPDTSVGGYNFFNRYFFPQSDKQAVIVDDRFNPGGQYADYVIDLLRRQPAAWYTQRYGGDWIVPGAYIPGPKVMLINEQSGSGGDLMPWAFHKFAVGQLIGQRTWGGLVGISEYPRLMDGGRVTAPSLAFYDENGWIVENVGVPPDVEVEQTPADIEAGKDPQLERAIAVLLDQLAAHPVQTIRRPPYPDKTK